MVEHHYSNLPPSPNSPAAFVICARCGASNPAVSEFCRQCGDAGVKPTLSTTARRRSPVVVALCASVITAIPLIGLHFMLMERNNRLHRLAIQRSNAEFNLTLGKTQIALNAGKSALRDAEAERQQDMDQVRQSRKVAALQAERDELKSDLQASAHRFKEAEDKYEEADRQLRNANGALREVREELDACSDKQAKTMQKLTETESRLRSAEGRNRQRDGYQP